jgi:hypothetical protein
MKSLKGNDELKLNIRNAHAIFYQVERIYGRITLKST